MTDYCDRCGNNRILYECDHCQKLLCAHCYGDYTFPLCRGCEMEQERIEQEQAYRRAMFYDSAKGGRV